jgi:hypothetical protein
MSASRSYMSIVAIWSCPNSRETRNSFRRDREIDAGAHQDFFEAADEFDYAQRFAFAVCGGEATEIKDGVTDNLAGTVEGDVSSAVAFEEFDSTSLQEVGGGRYVRGIRVAAQRDYRGVFQQDEDIADLFFLPESDQLLLQA